ncbi:unnamed protein product [Cylicocyclus nassatus]|uniref:G-protein coupled receptors family 1 profile domain-containing protein n=1 Tax=Cylicocyclus nassatus TaxID=53992 RepID=A0AA36HDE7_CYLNA|nr:unnamed protein product [Cylicocyclus nassatus]
MEPLSNGTLHLVEETSNYVNTCRIKNNPMDLLAVRMLMLALYSTVFIVAVSGNFLVVYVVIGSKRMQTVTNIFITNLAISDLMVNFTSLWLTPMYTYVGHWIWGDLLCHGLPLFQGTSIFISTLTLMAIAMDRYIVIVHHSSSMNINDRMSMRTCIFIVTMIWFISLMLVMPYAYHMRLTFITEPCNFWVCGEDWSKKNIKSVYGVIVMALQFIVPFVIIGISYHSIWSFLNGRRRLTTERAIETSREGFVKAIPFLRFGKPRGRVRVKAEERPGEYKSIATTHTPIDCSKESEENSNYQKDCLQSHKTFHGKNNDVKNSLESPDTEKVDLILTDDAEMHDNYLL